MRLHVTEQTPASEVAHSVVEQFENSAPYVHINGLTFDKLPHESATESIRAIASNIGSLALTNDNPTSDVWTLDGKTSPSKDRIPYHTDSPYYAQPEDIVSFWNMKESGDGGENVILPIERVLSLADGSTQTAELLEELSQLRVDFQHEGHSAAGTIIDQHYMAVRFDRRYVLGAKAAELANRFQSLLEGADSIADIIKLHQGDALFFNNTTTLHARLPYSNPDRLNYRVRINL